MNTLLISWPWYVSGPLIGLMVPLLLILGNKAFGVSSSLRHICAACIPAGIPFFKYDWKKEAWSLFFVAGIVIGAFIAAQFLSPYSLELLPPDVFSWKNLPTVQGLIVTIVGGFLIGFGTRYAGGCTSGHSIMGISTLQWPSVVATICFMAGGFFVANLILPLILKL